MQKVGEYIFLRPNEKIKTPKFIDTFKPNIKKQEIQQHSRKDLTSIKLQGIRMQLWG